MNTLKEDFILAKAGNEEAIEAILKRFKLVDAQKIVEKRKIRSRLLSRMYDCSLSSNFKI